LRRALQQRVIARWHVDVRIPVKDLGQRVWDEEQHQLIREAAKLWQELQDTPPRGRAIGPDDTLALLHERRAKALLLDPSLIREGGRCLQCHRLVTAPATCPDCRGQTETIKDLFAEATRQAIAQSAQVRYWPDQPAFQQAGGIAALARF
jgi:RNA polymerase subunit RPABC4/transcription elongation factor Spt4